VDGHSGPHGPKREAKHHRGYDVVTKRGYNLRLQTDAGGTLSRKRGDQSISSRNNHQNVASTGDKVGGGRNTGKNNNLQSGAAQKKHSNNVFGDNEGGAAKPGTKNAGGGKRFEDGI